MPTFAVAITEPAHTLLEVDFSSGTRYYSLSTDGVFSPNAGAQYLARMKTSGTVTYTGMDQSKALQHPRLQPVLYDPDDSLANLLGKGELWEGSKARTYWAPAGATGKSQWTQWFGGLLDDIQPQGRSMWQLTLQPPVRKLRSPFPLTQVNPFDFANADKTALGSQIPLIGGKHDDFGDQNTGAVPTIYVDKTGSNLYYLVCSGWRVVPRVYSGGALKTLTSQYTILQKTIGGRLYTIIHFLADQTTNQVTCDVEAPDTVGDGTGTPIFEATDVLRWVLENYVFNEYQGGNWLAGWNSNPGSGVSSTGAPINTASFATVKALLAGRAGGSAFAASRYFAGQTTGEQFINEWAASTGVDVVWDQRGNLTLLYDDCYSNDAGYNLPVLRFPSDFGEPRLGLDSASAVSTGIIQYEDFASEPQPAAFQGIHSKLKKQKPDPSNKDGRGYYQLQVTDPISPAAASVNLNATAGPHTSP